MIASEPVRRGRGRPAIQPPGRTQQEQLDAIEQKLDALLAKRTKTTEFIEAKKRFETTGEQALPLSVKQVALVLGKTVGAVHVMVCEKKLKRRFGSAGFHPDDVREFLASKAKERSQNT